MKLILGMFLIAALGSVGYIVFEPPPEPPPAEDPRFGERRYNPSETDWADYIWPTDASYAKTSSFCEFRRTHFHAGIDISTNMKRGYKVFASRGGWLHSIDFDPGGYGWFLVVKHYDGYYTCYAHLDGFPEAVEQAYLKKLAASNKSFGEATWAREEFPVKKGETIAFTGSTGAGPPHLHFEIRDRDFNPVNPEHAPNLRVKDSQIPEILQIAFVPLDAGSTVNGSRDTYIASVKQVNDTLYRLRSTPELSGRIGVQLRALDGAEGFKDMETPYSMVARINGKRHFDATFDRIQSGHGWLIRHDRNNELMLGMKGEFRKLYKEPGNALSVYLPDEPWAGVLSPETAIAGLNSYDITVTDMSGNSSTLLVTFEMAPKAQLSVSAAGTERVGVRCNATGTGVYVECLGTGREREVVFRERINGRLEQNIALPDSSSVYEIRVVDSTGRVLRRSYCSRNTGIANTMQVSYSVMGGDIIVNVCNTAGFNLPPVVLLRGGEGEVRAQVSADSPECYRSAITVPPEVKPPFLIEVKALIGGTIAGWSRAMDETYITPQNGGNLISTDGACRVEFGPGDVPVPAFYRIARRTAPQGPVYTVEPSDRPLTGELKVSMKPPYRHDGKNYIEARSPSIGMRYGTQKFDGDSPWVHGLFGRYPGEYRILRDTIGPEIRVATRRGGALLIQIDDEATGLDMQRVLIRAGKSVIPAVYNERRNGFEIPYSYLNQHRKGEIVITASDRIGNFCIRKVRI